MLQIDSMNGVPNQLIRDETGNGVIGYVLITGFFSILVFQPELLVAAVYRLADLLSLFFSQVEAIF